MPQSTTWDRYLHYLSKKNCVYPVIKIVRCLFALIVESTENAI